MSFLGSIFGEKPKIADYTPVNLSDEQLKALEGNIKNWPQIESLGNLYQSYMLNAYDRAIPGFKDILRMGGTTTKDMLDVSDKYLHGEIPEDVAGAVQRTSAFQNLLSGGGGAMASANVARNYGLTSMDLISKGATLAGEAGNAAQRWANLSGAQSMSGMLVTPQQMSQLAVQQNLIKQKIQQNKYNVAAAADPALSAINNWVAQVGGSVIASYAGGGMGGKGDYGVKTPNYAGMTGVTNPGYAGVDMGGGGGGPSSSGGYFGGYGGVSPGSDGTPAYYGIENNPFNAPGASLWNTQATPGATGSPLWDAYAYNSNFPTG